MEEEYQERKKGKGKQKRAKKKKKKGVKRDDPAWKVSGGKGRDREVERCREV